MAQRQSKSFPIEAAPTFSNNQICTLRIESCFPWVQTVASSVMQEGIDVAAVTKHLRLCSPVLYADGHRATLHVQLLWMVYLEDAMEVCPESVDFSTYSFTQIVQMCSSLERIQFDNWQCQLLARHLSSPPPEPAVVWALTCRPISDSLEEATKWKRKWYFKGILSR